MGCFGSKPTTGNSSQTNFRIAYDLGHKVGAGTFAQVRTCKCRHTGEDRVVKIIGKPYEKQDFDLEVDMLEEVGDGSCANVVKFHGHFEDSYFFYSVMELCSGGELFEAVETMPTFTERDIAFFTRQILLGVEHIHSRGIVHRDVKPQNLLFSDTNRRVLKVIDFGLSYRMPHRQLLDEPCGTPELFAPEMVLGRYGRKVDIWSVGCLVYIMLFGKVPFQGRSPKELFANIVEDEPSYESSECKWRPSSLALDFVCQLLLKNFKNRPTASQALDHQWLLTEGGSTHSEFCPSIPIDLRRKARAASVMVPRKKTADSRECDIQQQIEANLGKLDRSRGVMLGGWPAFGVPRVASSGCAADGSSSSMTSSVVGALSVPPPPPAAESSTCSDPNTCSDVKSADHKQQNVDDRMRRQRTIYYSEDAKNSNVPSRLRSKTRKATRLNVQFWDEAYVNDMGVYRRTDTRSLACFNEEDEQ
eukprot:CAMPEP_0113845026 /NCGR_PEP_ID=MMETSP0372-20130328/539_1 /TAXON_ID=340204 /ORGANISM="Lankesteria abbotti" /LENGTH=473 /DNA_ID=CAMNT_0000814045 /DNA_START=53 /DNA_END=1474 /DNA_ORIENTATION=+ /assembly_acc=CAM_ASM_000359